MEYALFTVEHSMLRYSYRSYEVASEQAVGFLVGENFENAVCVVVGLSTAVCTEWELAHLVCNTLRKRIRGLTL